MDYKVLLKKLRSAVEDPELVAGIKELEGFVGEQVEAVEQKTEAYVGLQRKIQKKDDALAEEKERVSALSMELSEIRSATKSTGSELEQVKAQLQALTGERDGLTTAQKQAQAKLHMATSIMEQYPDLAHLFGTLQPAQSEEATAEMLKSLNEKVSATIQSRVEAAVGKRVDGYVPGGNFQRGTGTTSTPGESTDLNVLLNELDAAAGTPGYEAAFQRYLTASKANGEPVAWPKPYDGSDYEAAALQNYR